MTDNRNIILISGRSGEYICNSVADNLQRHFSYPADILGKMNIKDFNNGEIFAQLQSHQGNRNIHVFQSFNDPSTDKLYEQVLSSNLSYESKIELSKRILTANRDVQEMLIIGDMLCRIAQRQKISLYLPYYPYSRQDKKDDGRVPISAALNAQLIDFVYGKQFTSISTVDIHSEQIQGTIREPFQNIPMAAPFALYVKSHFESLDDLVIVSPDAGGVKRARSIAGLLDLPLAVIDKRRESHGEAFSSGVMGDVKGKKPIIYDDMGDTLGSLLESRRILLEAGAKEDITALLTHGIFSKKIDSKTGQLVTAENRAREAGIKIITTDSIPRSSEYRQKNKDIFPQYIGLGYPLAELIDSRRGISWSAKWKSLEDTVRKGLFSTWDVRKYIIDID